jgi:hypothetical protein
MIVLCYIVRKYPVSTTRDRRLWLRPISPQGPWSNASTIVTSTKVPGGIWSTGCGLDFTLSLWSNCSVMLMRTTLGSAS